MFHIVTIHLLELNTNIRCPGLQHRSYGFQILVKEMYSDKLMRTLFLPFLKGKTQVPPSKVGQECGGNGSSKHIRSSMGKALKSLLDFVRLCEVSLQGSSNPSQTSIEVSPLLPPIAKS